SFPISELLYIAVTSFPYTTLFRSDIERNLRGVCDFLLSLSPLQLTIEAPVVAIVRQGIVQCIAEMVAAQQFNREQGNPIPAVYGDRKSTRLNSSHGSI